MAFTSAPKPIANYSQTPGTNIRDILTANHQEILYGGLGDDDLAIANQLHGEIAILSGGSGDDMYTIKDRESALIVDLSRSPNIHGYDTVKINSPDTHVYMSVIDGNHLFATDIFSGATVLIYDAFGNIDYGNRVEEILFSNKSYEIADIQPALMSNDLRSRILATKLPQILEVYSIEIIYGTATDDNFFIENHLSGETAILSGGNGNDIYNVKDQESVLIVELPDTRSSGGYDIVKFDSINKNVYFAILDDRHLLITDIFSQATAFIYDAFGRISNHNRLEKISMLDRVYTIEEIELAARNGDIAARPWSNLDKITFNQSAQYLKQQTTVIETINAISNSRDILAGSWGDLGVVAFDQGVQRLEQSNVIQMVDLISANQQLIDTTYLVNQYFQPNDKGVYEAFSFVDLNHKASSSADEISGTIDRDFVRLLDGDDVFRGGDGSDSIYGNQGFDVLLGNRGDDVIYGNMGGDVIYGGQNDDIVYGNLGSDLLYGNKGDDVIYGGKAHDIIYGNDGNDRLFGNKGNDQLWGGAGSDLFGLTLNSGSSYVYDFNGIEGDRILSNSSSRLTSNNDGDAMLVLQDLSFMVLNGVAVNQFDMKWILLL